MSSSHAPATSYARAELEPTALQQWPPTHTPTRVGLQGSQHHRALRVTTAAERRSRRPQPRPCSWQTPPARTRRHTKLISHTRRHVKLIKLISVTRGDAGRLARHGLHPRHGPHGHKPCRAALSPATHRQSQCGHPILLTYQAQPVCACSEDMPRHIHGPGTCRGPRATASPAAAPPRAAAPPAAPRARPVLRRARPRLRAWRSRGRPRQRAPRGRPGRIVMK
jgi:hypothetical protein